MINQLFTGTPTSPRQVTLPDVSAFDVAGVPILVGTEPAFTLDARQDNVAGATCYFNGSFFTDVIGETSASPLTPAAIKPGDKVYAVGGTLDSATNVRYGFTLSADSSGIFFGTIDPSPQGGGPVPSGETANVAVRLGE
jgi:hypothetical protein